MGRKKLVILLVFFLTSESLLAWGKRDEKSLTQFKEAVEGAYKGGDFKGVVEQYRAFVDQNPDRRIPLVVTSYYGEALAALGQVGGAIDVLKTITAEIPPSLDLIRAQYNLANLLFMENRQQEARGAYEKVLLIAKEHNELVGKARDRLEKMKAKEVGGKDKTALELFDIESALTAGEIPVGAEEFLNNILAKEKKGENLEKAKELVDLVQEVKEIKVRSLLNEARRLFDVERKYLVVKEMLEGILKEFPNTRERRSVETLLEEVNNRLRRQGLLKNLPESLPESLPAETKP